MKTGRPSQLRKSKARAVRPCLGVSSHSRLPFDSSMEYVVHTGTTALHKLLLAFSLTSASTIKSQISPCRWLGRFDVTPPNEAAGLADVHKGTCRAGLV